MQDADRKKRIWPFALVAFGLAYLFLASRPLGVERGFRPRWVVRALDAASADFPPDDLVAFRLKDRFGFVSAQDGDLALSRLTAQGVALGDAVGFAAWAEFQGGRGPASFSSPSGEALFSLPSPEAPFFLEGRLFSISADDGGISSWNPDGTKAWSRDAPAPITCISASREVTALGCLDGSLVLIGLGGEELFSFVPGGSRIPVVMGVALSPDGRFAAVVSGVQPQRFLLFELRSGGYKLKRHFDLKSDFRRRVAMAFSLDGRLVFLEQKGLLEVVPVSGERLPGLALPGPILAIHPGSSEDLHVVHCRDGAASRVMAFNSEGRFVMAAGLPGDCALISRKGNGLYLGSGERVARLDMVEEGR